MGLDPLDAVIVVTRHLAPVSTGEVDAVERDLGVAMPSGYRAFMSRFGEALYADLFEIWSPSTVRQRLATQRDLLTYALDHEFYESGADTPDPSSVPTGVPIGVSIDGDVLLVHAAWPGALFILPRDSAPIGRIEPDFSDLHRWPVGVVRLPTLQGARKQATVGAHASRFSLDRDKLLARAGARWGVDGVRVAWEREDAWSWATVCFLPEPGLRFQAVEDEGVTRTVIERGTRTTYMGSGTRSLSIQARGDAEGIADVYAFLDDLESVGLVDDLTRDATDS